MKRTHAIVLGGGCAGMLAGSILSDYFEHVTLIEHFEDFLNPKSRVRQGIPQAHHLHVLLKKGQIIFNQLFPGIIDRLLSHCPEMDWSLDTRWQGPFGMYPSYPSLIKTALFSRVYLDQLMIERIKTIPNLRIEIGKAMLRLLPHHGYTLELMIKNRNNALIKMEGELIVDARGRHSHLSKTFKQAGLAVPVISKIATELGYASQRYQLPRAIKQGKQFYSQVFPGKSSRGFVYSPIENHQSILTLIGIGKDQPSRENEGLRYYLDFQYRHELQYYLQHAAPLDEIKIYRKMDNIHYHFGKMIIWPKGLIVMGDATCELNPVYGQGMTLAAQQALLLKDQCEQIKQSPALLEKNWEQGFQKKIDKLLYLPWLMVTAADQKAASKNTLPLHLRGMQWYLERVLQSAVTNKEVHHLFLQVLHMLRQPYALFTPKTLVNLFLRGK